MKLVMGETLAQAIQKHHEQRRIGQEDPLGLPRLLNVFVKVCDALAYAHSRGIIHRDLKPQNIVLGEYGEAIVLDWGLAKQISSSDEETAPVVISEEAMAAATRAGSTPGTLPYMSPEQAAGRVDLMDQLTDIYGLGAILFEILTGQPPHVLKSSLSDGNTLHETGAVESNISVHPISAFLTQVANAESPRPRDRDEFVSLALDAVCAKALAKSRSDRYANAKELADDVQRYLADEPVTVIREPLTIRAQRWMTRGAGNGTIFGI